jgi:hypothetical protein
MNYDSPMSVTVPAGGYSFFSVFGAVGQVISVTAVEPNTVTNNVSLYISQAVCPTASNYRYKRDAYPRNYDLKIAQLK